MELRKAVAIVAGLNLAYFGVEFAVALEIGSVSLFADSVDFLEDAAVNFLILAALGWSERKRATVGLLLAGIILVPGIATAWTAFQKWLDPSPPEPWSLSLTAAGALTINLFCALLLARFRHDSGSLTKAAFLSARNDALANVAIIGGGIATAFWATGWPDLMVGIGVMCLNADAARQVYAEARREHSRNETERYASTHA